MANTPAYNVPLPDVGGSRNLWGTLNNTLHNTWDSLLGGSTPVTGIDINSGTIDGVTIGAATPSTGAFTTLSSSGNTTLGDAAGDTLTINSAAWSAPNGFAIDTNKLVLDSAGNAGLGVVPSASSLPTVQSQFGLFLGNDQVNIVNNGYFDGVYKYTSSGFASRLSMNSTSGNLAFNTAPSGTAGSPITFTQAMTLTNGGNLLVGTTASNANSAAIFSGQNFSGRALTLTSGTNNAAAATSVSLTLAHFGDGSLPEVGSVIRSVENAVNTLSGYLAFETYGAGSVRTEAGRFTSNQFFKASNTGSYGDVAGLADNSASVNHLFQSDEASATIASVNGNTAAGVRNYDSYLATGAAGFHYQGRVNDSVVFQVLANGDVQSATNSYGPISSDPRLKENIDYNVSYLDDLMRLEVCKFSYKSENLTEPNQLGFLTSNIKEVFPKLIKVAGPAEKFGLPEGEPDVETYKASVLLPIAIRALQEANEKINQLTTRITALEAK